jgi:serine/threonine-protein kinase
MSGDQVAAVPPPSSLPIAPGQIIAERYLVGEVLGGGGMGVVCAGTHVLLGTPVAIKLISSELKDDAEAIVRFMNEARAAAALKGEHIARVFDVGQLESGEPYLVMEQLEGLGLDQYLLGQGPLPASEAVAIALQVCEGLAEAHAAALVHRDIKPGNLFLARRPDGQFSVKIIDFGIAKQPVSAQTPALTNPGKSLGSPWYMSPEQMLTPASVDQRADLWSIGVLLFELLTGQLPFTGESVPQVCALVLTATPAKPSELRSGIPPELDAIVLRCLEKEANDRFASVDELATALRPLAAPQPEAAPPLELSSSPFHDPSSEARSAPKYDSLVPLHSTREVPLLRSRPRLALAVALVAFFSLAIGGYLQYRDPTLVRRAVAARIHLPSDPVLSPAPPVVPLQSRYEPAPLLQTLRAGHAHPEPERPEPAAGFPLPADAPPSASGDETKQPTLKRVVEQRYGL